MEEGDRNSFHEIVENLFMRWSALKLAVEHGMGGKTGKQTALEAMNYVFEYCIGNDNVTQSEIQEILEEIMDQEFDTICEDNSTVEISTLLTKYLTMMRDKQYDALRLELSSMPPCNEAWLKPHYKVQYVKESDSSCSDEEDEEMDTSNNASNEDSTNRKNATKTDEDGWTTVTSKRKQ